MTILFQQVFERVAKVRSFKVGGANGSFFFSSFDVVDVAAPSYKWSDATGARTALLDQFSSLAHRHRGHFDSLQPVGGVRCALSKHIIDISQWPPPPPTSPSSSKWRKLIFIQFEGSFFGWLVGRVAAAQHTVAGKEQKGGRRGSIHLPPRHQEKGGTGRRKGERVVGWKGGCWNHHPLLRTSCTCCCCLGDWSVPTPPTSRR